MLIAGSVRAETESAEDSGHSSAAKVTRRRIALQRLRARYPGLFPFREALGVRTRLRVAFAARAI